MADLFDEQRQQNRERVDKKRVTKRGAGYFLSLKWPAPLFVTPFLLDVPRAVG